MIKQIFIFILVLIILFIISIVIFGIFFKSSDSGQIYINPNGVSIGQICQNVPVSCSTDSDCKQQCIDSEVMTCQELTRNSDQETKYGKSGKYCLPQKPQQTCNSKNGGIWSWTGWSGSNNMEWECLCTYPQIAGGNGCENINPNVCNGGIFNYDATTMNRGPSPEDCQCANNNYLMVTNNNVPLCILENDYLCGGNNPKKMCESMYSNTNFVK